MSEDMRRLLRAELRVAANTHPKLASYIAGQRFSWGFAARDVLEALLNDFAWEEFAELAAHIRAKPGAMRAILEARATASPRQERARAEEEAERMPEPTDTRPEAAMAEASAAAAADSAPSVIAAPEVEASPPPAAKPQVDPATLDAWRKVFPG